MMKEFDRVRRKQSGEERNIITEKAKAVYEKGAKIKGGPCDLKKD
jgi:hypothetical protein